MSQARSANAQATRSWFIVFAAALGLTLSAAQAAEPASSVGASAELQEVLADLNALGSWLDAAQQKQALLQQNLRQQDQRINLLGESARSISKELADTRKAVRDLQKENDTLLLRRQQQQQALELHLRAAARLTKDDAFKQVFNQTSPAEIDRLLRYHGYFNRQRGQLIQSLQQTAQNLEATNQRLIMQLDAEKSQLESLNQRTAELKKQRQRQALAARNLASERRSKEAQQAALKADQKRLQELLIALRQQAVGLDGRAFADAKGKLSVPVGGAIRHKFGAKRFGSTLTWRGVDIGSDLGAPVSAVFRGKVVFADWLRGFGLVTIIDHGSEYMSLYGHAEALMKKAGDWVEGGEMIATAGQSGGQYEPGIYFELRHKGEVMNPQPWLVR